MFEVRPADDQPKIACRIISKFECEFILQKVPDYGDGLVLIVDDPCPTQPNIFVEFHDGVVRRGCTTKRSEGKIIILMTCDG